MDEVMRHSGIVSGNMRVATVDAPLLGCIIPKGVDVFMPVGRSYSLGGHS